MKFKPLVKKVADKMTGKDPVDALSRHYTQMEKELFGFSPKHRSIVCFADVELHQDDKMKFDGLTIRDNRADGDGTIAFIPAPQAAEFLESCAKVAVLLKKRDLMPKETAK